MIRNTGVRPQMIPGIITGTATYVLATLIAAGVIPEKLISGSYPNDVDNHGYGTLQKTG